MQESYNFFGHANLHSRLIEVAPFQLISVRSYANWQASDEGHMGIQRNQHDSRALGTVWCFNRKMS